MDAARNSEGGAGSFFHHLTPHHHHHDGHHQQNLNPSASPPSSAAIPNSNDHDSFNNSSNASLYPHLVASAVATSSEGVKRKRGRPRKYATPEEAAAAKRLSASSSSTAAAGSRKRVGDNTAGSSSSSFPDKSPLNMSSIGTTGQGFTSSVVIVADGEDVRQRIIMFMQQSKREICIMSASGSVSYATLRRLEPPGHIITYKGPLDILSLSGSYIHADRGGHTGGLSVSLCSPDGQFIGGEVGGPLPAAGPVQVIIGSFLLINVKKDVNGAASSAKPTPPLGGGGGGGLNLHGSSHQTGVGMSQFFAQQQLMPPHSSTEWRGHTAHHGLHLSPENNISYQHIPD